MAQKIGQSLIGIQYYSLRIDKIHPISKVCDKVLEINLLHMVL